MTVELAGPAGTLHLRPDCSFTIRRGGEIILAAEPAFAELYGVTFPAVSRREVLEDGTALRATFDTSWPGRQIRLQVSAEPDGFRMEWSCQPPTDSVGLAFRLATGGPWYGLGERVIQGWPLERFGVVSELFAPIDHAGDGTLNICTPLCLNAAGTGLLVEEDTGNLSVMVNRDGDGRLRILQRPPDPPPAEFDQPVEPPPARLLLRILIADHLPAAQRLAVKYLGQPSSAPPIEVFVRPIWTTWAQYKMHVTQADTLRFADEIIARGFPFSVMEIDDRWQSVYGDLRFDPAKFPNPVAMVDQLHARGFQVTLWVPPYFYVHSDGYREAAARGYLLRHAATGEPALTSWWQGYGAVLDVSNPEALDWWQRGLRRLQEEYGVDTFKFDGGEGNFVPRGALSAGKLTPTNYTDAYIAFITRNFPWSEVRCGWRSQRQGIFLREWDKWSRWGLDNGLHSVLTQALALGLVGYPFVLPDMIGGNAYGGEAPDAELLVRWAQLTALLPSMQFSLAPWNFGPQASEICLRYARLHEDLGPVLKQCVAEALASGTPMVRPLFWHAPDDRETYTVDDEFTLGDRLLVAPVVQPGQRERSVYLPAGCWRDRWMGKEYDGPRHIDRHPAPLEALPLFEKLD